jgi:glycosyltransferase involved in cell wall biosynthesis
MRAVGTGPNVHEPGLGARYADAMNILMVNEKGWFFGGVEQLVNDVATGLAERGHRIALLSTEALPQGRDPLSAPFAASSCLDPTVSLDAWKQRVKAMVEEFEIEVAYIHRLAPAAAIEAILEYRPVVRYVHDHDLYCPRRHKYFPLTTRICNRPMGTACVAHGCLLTPNGPWPGIPWLINLPQKHSELQFNRRLPRLCVGSNWMRDMMVTNGFSADQVEVLPPIPMGLEQEPSSLDTEPIVLFVGQVIRGKGVDLLLRALAEVRQPFRALIVGTGNHMQACVELARKLKLGGQVSFLGWVSHDRIGDYFGRARVVAVPSRWPEPFGMVGLEAMWASRPVVAFAVGGIPDWLADGESGFAVPEQDWKLYGQAIEQLLEEPQLAARMGRHGYDMASEKFRFDTQIDRTEAMLRRAVQS